jgi:hypothetical protein
MFACGLLAAGLFAGCSDGPKLARVSGVVKLDGKPYPNALVSFQPVGTRANANPGKGSMGQTDANGQFVLLYDGGREGAVVGTHTVRITTVPGKGAKEDPNIDKSLGSPDGGDLPMGGANLEFDPIPMEWNEKSTKTFDVLPGGTPEANFNIVTKRK